MATCWKVYAPAEKVAGGAEQDSQSEQWEDTEVAELRKLARQATETARQSMKFIDADKAEACRRQLLQEMKAAK